MKNAKIMFKLSILIFVFLAFCKVPFYDVSATSEKEEKVIAGIPLNAKPAGEFNESYVSIVDSNDRTLSFQQDVLTQFYNDITIGDENKAADLTLHIKSGERLNITGNVIVYGDLEITGIGTLAINGNITVYGNVIIDGTTIIMNDYQNNQSFLTLFGDTFTLRSARIEHAYFVGYDATVTGVKNISLENTNGLDNIFDTVGTFGVHPNALARVIFNHNAINTLQTKSTTIISDCPLTFYDQNEKVINHTDWLDFYRVQTIFDDDFKITNWYLGTHNDEVYTSFDTGLNELPLPEYAIDGYRYQGWMENNNEQLVNKALPNTSAGTTKLSVVLESKAVSIVLNRDYVPNKYTNDDYQMITQEYNLSSFVHAKFPNEVLYRFGYEFIGWEVLSGTNNSLISVADFDAMLIELDDLNYLVETDSYELQLKAVWSAKSYPVQFQIVSETAGGNIDSITLRCYRNECPYCHNSGLKLDDFVEKHQDYVFSYSQETHVLRFNTNVVYGESFAEYLISAKIDNLTVYSSTGTYYMQSWISDSSYKSNDNYTFTFGENGYFGDNLPKDMQTLVQYDAALETHKFPVFKPEWSLSAVDINFSPKNTWYNNKLKIWSIAVNDIDVTNQISNDGRLENVQIGSKVTFHINQYLDYKNDLQALGTFSLWTISDYQGNPINTYEEDSGSGYCYSFIVPVGNVTANFASDAEDTVVNLKESPITDARIVIDGHKRDGFWTNQLIPNLQPAYDVEKVYGYLDECNLDIEAGIGYTNGSQVSLRYFYEYSIRRAFWITTEDASKDVTGINNGTQNQYFCERYPDIVKNVYLKDCHLWATSMYSSIDKEAADKFLSTYKNESLIAYSNIYFNMASGTSDNPNGGADATNVYFDGFNNIVAVIGGTGGYNSWLYLYKNSQMTEKADLGLGCLMGIGYHIINNCDIYAYDNPNYPDNHPYPRTKTSPYCNAINSTLNLPNKTNIRTMTLINSIGVFDKYLTATSISGNSILVVNQIKPDYNLSVSGNSSLIVTGDVFVDRTYSGFSTIDTTGVVAFLGNYAKLVNLQVKNGLVIANALESNSYNLIGGTIIANSLRNPTGEVSDHPLSANGDNDFIDTNSRHHFVSLTGDAKVAYHFGGNAQIHLMGYFDNNPNLRGKIETVLQSPLSRFVDGINLDSIEDIKTSIDRIKNNCSSEVINEVYEECKANYKDNECIILGNSSYGYYENGGRLFLIDGATIRCAGRMTLFNQTVINSGIIYAESLGCKQDFTINGGSIYAKEIGIASEYTNKLSDKSLHYSQLYINGGKLYTNRIGTISQAQYLLNPNSINDATVLNKGIIRTFNPDSVNSLNPSEDIYLYHDVYVNYNYDDSLYVIPDDMINIIGVYAKYMDNIDYKDLNWSILDGEPFDFSNPLLKTLEEATNVFYSLSTASLIEVLGYDASGTLVGDNQIKAIELQNLVIYLIEAQEFNLYIYQDNSYIDRIKIDSNELVNNGLEQNLKVISTANVEIELNNTAMLDKIILWYQDINGVYHNLYPIINGNIVSFEMPFVNCELYITEEFILYLDLYEITVLNDGFRIERDETRKDSTFKYAGDLLIKDSRVESSSFNYDNIDDATINFYDHNGNKISGNILNMLQFVENFEQNNRKITLSNVRMSQLTNSSSILVKANSTVTLNIFDIVQLYSIYLEDSCNFNLTADQTDEIKDRIILQLNGSNVSAQITGDNFKKISISNLYFGGRCDDIIYGNGSQQLVFDNCEIEAYRGRIARNLDSVTFNHCLINIPDNRSLQCRLVSNTYYMTIKNSIVNYNSENVIFDSYLKKVVIDNSSLLQRYYAVDTGVVEDIINCSSDYSLGSFEIINNSIFQIPSSLSIENNHSMVIDSGSSVYIGYNPETGEALGRIICTDLMVGHNANLYARYVVTSGFKNVRNVIFSGLQPKEMLERTYNGINSAGITVDGGNIYAEFVGGDYNGRVTLISGSIKALYIGTYGAYFFRELEKNGSYLNKWTYAWDSSNPKMINKAIINVLGGSIEILENGHLGGYDSEVFISGGNIIGNDIIGNKVDISGNMTLVDINNLIATKVNISGASYQHLDNLYHGGNHSKVAVLIKELLYAQDFLINNGSIVYANLLEAYAYEGETSHFTVATDGSALYTTNFGVIGEGEHILDFRNIGDDKNIWGIQLISILYDLNIAEDDIDPIESLNNPEYYAFEFGGIINLQAPTRSYYNFLGWYDSAGELVTEISTGIIPRDYQVRLEARWSPITVKFYISFNPEGTSLMDPAIYERETESLVNNGLGILQDGRFYWMNPITVNYNEFINGQLGKLHFIDYSLVSYRFTSARWTTLDLDINGTRVSREMVDKYLELTKDDPESALIIHLYDIVAVLRQITFDLNIKDGKPCDAVYGPLNAVNGVTEWELTVDNNLPFDYFSNTKEFLAYQATAFGYDFLGWSSNKDANETNFKEYQLVESAIVNESFPTKYYAIWVAKKYVLEFDVVTNYNNVLVDGIYHLTNGTIPSLNDPNSIIVKDGEASLTHSKKALFDYDKAIANEVPKALKEGGKFVTWYYYDRKGNIVQIDLLDSYLTILDIVNVDLIESNNPDDIDNSSVGITFYALYNDIRVTYDLMGGQWTVLGTSNIQEYESTDLVIYPLGSPLRAYTYDETSQTYSFISTTTDEYYQNGQQYLPGDYREVLLKRGYTFQGWYDSFGNLIVSTPRFEDIYVKASWKENTYNINLYSSSAYDIYREGVTFKTLDSDGKPVADNYNNFVQFQATIGSSIGYIENWPARTAWGTIKDGFNGNARPLWGFVNVPLDPLHPDYETEYNQYNINLEKLFNSDLMYVRNDATKICKNVFSLPNETELRAVLGDSLIDYYIELGILNFDDLPDGSSMNLYATYRDYALLFMQYYIKPNGDVHRIVQTTFYGSLEDKDLNPPVVETPEGYEFVGWYVNTTEIDNERLYDATKILNQINHYKEEARKLGTYDVIVYSIYVASVTFEKMNMNVDVYGQKDESIIHASRILSFEIPRNMQNASSLFYQIYDRSSIPLNLVSKDTILNSLYSLKIGEHSSNETLALVLSLYDESGNLLCEYDLIKSENTLEIIPDDSQKLISGGCYFTLTLYHSYVMTEETSYSININFGFKKDNAIIKNQTINIEALGIYIKPSLYDVTYDAAINDINKKYADDEIIISDNGSFTANGHYQELIRFENMTLNSLLSQVTLPTIEGYRQLVVEKGWKIVNGTGNKVLNYDSNGLILDALANGNQGIINLEADWEIIKYHFEVTDEVLAKWQITNEDGIISSSNLIDYQSRLKFTPIGNEEAAFISFAIADSLYRLDLTKLAQVDNYYIWQMPANDVLSLYQDYVDLYLEIDNIIIYESKYVYQGEEVYWPGHYNILMNPNNDASLATNNTLSLNDNLRNNTYFDQRNIHLGNLNIESKDSINITKDSGVVLKLNYLNNASNLKISNIFVSTGVDLIIEGFAANLTLNPLNNTAGIGSLKGGLNSNITINDTNILVLEASNYIGTWLGGANINQVKLNNVTLNQTLESYAVGRYAVYATQVIIDNSLIGSKETPIYNPLYAEDKLTINGCEIYQSVCLPLGSISALGTSQNGVIEIDKDAINNSYINSAYDLGGNADRLFTGTMYLYNALSEVIIANTMILELAHGDLVIENNMAIIGNIEKSFSGNYLLLEELLKTDINPQLTVNGIKGTIHTYKPLNTSFILGDMIINDDTRMIVDGKSSFNGYVIIANDKVLSVESNAQININELEIFKDSYGSYYHEGGKILAVGDVGSKTMNITLVDTEFQATSLYAVDLFIEDSKVNCSDVIGSYGIADGLTTVTFNGNSLIYAPLIGALGLENETFTQVMINNADNLYIDGELVRDIYKINYHISNNYALGTNCKYVIRATQMCDDSAPVILMEKLNTPYIIDIPTPLKANRFITWYIFDQSNGRIALFETEPLEYAKHQNLFVNNELGLDIHHLTYASLDINGIPTITVYAYLETSGDISLIEGERYSPFLGETKLTIPVNQAFSMMLTLNTRRELGENYGVTFDDYIPLDTRLILVLIDRNDGLAKYYYYTVTESRKTIMFTEFKAMGTNNALILGESNRDVEQFIITVDYRYAYENENIKAIPNQMVSFAYQASTLAEIESLNDVYLTTYEVETSANITFDDEAFTVTLPQNEQFNDKEVCITATVDKDLPYDYQPMLLINNQEVIGKIIGGNLIVFKVGTYDINTLEFNCSKFNGSQDYTYKWSVELYEAFNSDNKFMSLTKKSKQARQMIYYKEHKKNISNE